MKVWYVWSENECLKCGLKGAENWQNELEFGIISAFICDSKNANSGLVSDFRDVQDYNLQADRLLQNELIKAFQEGKIGLTKVAGRWAWAQEERIIIKNEFSYFLYAPENGSLLEFIKTLGRKFGQEYIAFGKNREIQIYEISNASQSPKISLESALFNFANEPETDEILPEPEPDEILLSLDLGIFSQIRAKTFPISEEIDANYKSIAFFGAKSKYTAIINQARRQRGESEIFIDYDRSDLSENQRAKFESKKASELLSQARLRRGCEVQIAGLKQLIGRRHKSKVAIFSVHASYSDELYERFDVKRSTDEQKAPFRLTQAQNEAQMAAVRKILKAEQKRGVLGFFEVSGEYKGFGKQVVCEVSFLIYALPGVKFDLSMFAYFLLTRNFSQAGYLYSENGKEWEYLCTMPSLYASASSKDGYKMGGTMATFEKQIWGGKNADGEYEINGEMIDWSAYSRLRGEMLKLQNPEYTPNSYQVKSALDFAVVSAVSKIKAKFPSRAEFKGFGQISAQMPYRNSATRKFVNNAYGSWALVENRGIYTAYLLKDECKFDKISEFMIPKKLFANYYEMAKPRYYLSSQFCYSQTPRQRKIYEARQRRFDEIKKFMAGEIARAFDMAFHFACVSVDAGYSDGFYLPHRIVYQICAKTP